MRCDKCKSWKKFEDPYEDSVKKTMGKCDAIPMLYEATEWDEDYDNRKIKDEYKNTKAFAQDGSDYWAYLMTKPDFGCVMYAALDESQSEA